MSADVNAENLRPHDFALEEMRHSPRPKRTSRPSSMSMMSLSSDFLWLAQVDRERRYFLHLFIINLK